MHIMLRATNDGERYELNNPTAMPKASGFLWNQKMMIQVTCRGYSTSQFMQPEPAKYAHAPNLEMKTFMQPEQNYYAHHPGRFVYIKDEESNELFSAPFEPVRAKLDKFTFSVGKSDISWTVEYIGIRVQMTVLLPTQDVTEPYFPFGYMSWMNQEAEWKPHLGAIVGSSKTPYQKAEDYPKTKFLKDKTYLLCEEQPVSWEAKQETFEGEGGLHNPSSLQEAQLSNSDARYETPTAIVQYRVSLQSSQERDYRFLFGPALDDDEIQRVKDKFLSKAAFDQAAKDYRQYIKEGSGCLKIKTPDENLDNLVNNWLPRQMYYHGDVNRLTTDPQTRNYLQDNMGMSFIKPKVARNAILTAVSQQEQTGAMPDGVLLAEGAELKYINQVPHTDHCVWLPVALEIYLNETGDYALLEEKVTSMHGDTYTVFERFNRAMDWLTTARDHRGLSFIAQGDWCDPMNMVGPKGVGVSGWLTVATAYALNLWASICKASGNLEFATKYRKDADTINECANKHLWDGDWYARGITDDNVTFGIKNDKEGRIWLNPQAWSILGGAASSEQIEKILPQVDEQLNTPYGVVMFAPPYTAMREDVGRVTQKYPGQGENGSIYNHASAFYAWALYTISQSDRAYSVIRQMIPGPSEKDYIQRGQLPVYIPNYYRGGWKTYPRTAGRSSQLFNTGTVSWVYRSLVEGLCGLRGDKEGLWVRPQMPSQWDEMEVTRIFRGATLEVNVKRGDVSEIKVQVDGELLNQPFIEGLQAGKTYSVVVEVPKV